MNGPILWPLCHDGTSFLKNIQLIMTTRPIVDNAGIHVRLFLTSQTLRFIFPFTTLSTSALHSANYTYKKNSSLLLLLEIFEVKYQKDKHILRFISQIFILFISEKLVHAPMNCQGDMLEEQRRSLAKIILLIVRKVRKIKCQKKSLLRAYLMITGKMNQVSVLINNCVLKSKANIAEEVKFNSGF